MPTLIAPEQAEALLKKYNKDPFHIRHAYTVAEVMKAYAGILGKEEEAEYWYQAGLLHDIDFELYPEEHCHKAPELLREAGACEELVHFVCSHGWPRCSDAEPVLLGEKVLFAADELTGLIWACALMRPSKSCADMELSSLKKKFKDKKFAAGCSRDVIKLGADRLEWPLEELLEKTLEAMKTAEGKVEEKMASLS